MQAERRENHSGNASLTAEDRGEDHARRRPPRSPDPPALKNYRKCRAENLLLPPQPWLQGLVRTVAEHAVLAMFAAAEIDGGVFFGSVKGG